MEGIRSVAYTHLFKNRNDAVRIFLCGDKDSRIKRIMDKHGISESKACLLYTSRGV